jgi:hypothetical protein
MPHGCANFKSDLLSSFQDCSSLYHLEISPEMMINPTQTESQPSIYSPNLAIKQISDPLPTGLNSLVLRTYVVYTDRPHTWWLELIKDLIEHQKRLSCLRCIDIIVDKDVTGYCQGCAEEDLPCSLCTRSKISDTMKLLCNTNGIDLSIILSDTRMEIDNQDFYNARFDDLEL